MTDRESLTEAERLLKDLENEIIQRIEGMKDSTSAPAMNSAVGRVSYIDAYQSQQMALHGQRKLQSQLESIRVALDRVKAGTYGRCDGCGLPIPPERLEVAPEARYCVKCQSRFGR